MVKNQIFSQFLTKMEMDFSKICRVCLNEGIMMSIFKVNVSKKIMACASVQVWQNDGLPVQICNKCSAKLHISFQFKKQCEKSDAKLRQYLSAIPQENIQHQQQQSEHIQHQQVQEIQVQQQIAKLEHIDLTQTAASQNNCVYIECTPMLEVPQQHQQEQKFESFVPVSQNQQPPLAQLNYNIQPQNHIQLGGYNMQVGVGQLQVYNGTYTMQPMQPANILHNQVVAPQMQIPHQQQLAPLQSIMQQALPHNVTLEDNKDEGKKSIKNRRDLIKTDDTNKQCPTCNKIFATTPKLTRHMKTHSTDMPYKCKVCTKAFSHSGNYKIHLRMHTDERPYRCSVCDKGCRQAQDLEKHMRTHTGERPHKCNLCTRAFSTSSNLIAHIRTHTGERPYVCCVCQKAFCQSNELTKHMRTHTGEKSHMCDICHKGFNGSSTLIVHRRSHTGERPYVCSVCTKGFAQSSCLAVHMKRHTGEKNFPCSSCDRSFVTNADLKEHLLTHSGDKPFSCNVCDKKYSRVNDLNRHTRTHTFKTLDES